MPGLRVSPKYFDLLGVEPALGTAFAPEARLPGRPPVAILSHRLWQSRFGGDPGVVGRTVRLGQGPATVVGLLGVEGAWWAVRELAGGMLSDAIPRTAGATVDGPVLAFALGLAALTTLLVGVLPVIRAVPGVSAAAAMSRAPMTPGDVGLGFALEGREMPPGMRSVSVRLAAGAPGRPGGADRGPRGGVEGQGPGSGAGARSSSRSRRSRKRRSVPCSVSSSARS